MVRPQQLFPTRFTAGVDPLEGGDPIDFAATYPVLIVPAFFTAADAELDWLAEYAAAGGHLVLGPRSAYADREGRARTEVQPARLDGVAGAWYEEFANLTDPIPVGPATAAAADAATGFVLRPGSAATEWVDGLTPTGAEPLARYEHPHFGRWPAVTSAVSGSGRVTVVGTVPNQELARSLAEWLVPAPSAGWTGLPESVTVTGSTAADGSRVYFVHNWSWTPQEAPAPGRLSDVRAGTAHDAGDLITLGPWDVRVFTDGAAE
jgi:beta-galactosidase